MWLGHSQLVDAGIDWFTTTATDRKTALLLLIKAERIMAQEHRRGCFIKPWRLCGYSGWRCGQLEYGTRDDGAIVRLSGYLAACEWWDLYQVTGRCSRVDLQATLRHELDPNRAIAKVSRSFKKFYVNRTDGPTITEWRDSNGGQTLYLGKRQSDLYFRCYNKAAESQDDFYAGCVRLELEVKHRLCRSVIESLLGYEDIHAGVLGILSSFMQERGGAPLTVLIRPTSLYEVCQTMPSVVKSLEWLNKQVRPSVIALCKMGHYEQVLEHLGLTEFVRSRAADCDNLELS